MRDSTNTLSQPVHLRVIGKYLGQLLLLLALLNLVPLLVAASVGEYHIMTRYAVVIAVLLAVSLPLSRLGVPEHIQGNEAMAISALAFVAAPLITAYPMMASGLSFADALFEAVSALTTTGLTTVTGLEERPLTFLFARAWMQWYGGLGIVVFSIALLMGHQLAARQLADASGGEIMATTARTHARHMLGVYLALTLSGLLLLWALTGDGFGALLHVLAAVSTGGFTPHDASLAAFDALSVRYAVIGLALCGAVPLPLYYLAWRRRMGEVGADVELRGLVLLVVASSTLLVLLLHFSSGLDWRQSLGHGVLLGISAQSTSGFASLDIVQLDDATKLATITSMLIGGGLGSTAGGFKIVRLLILLRLFHLLLVRSAMPSHAMLKFRLGHRTLENNEIQQAALLVLLFVFVVLVSWFVFLCYGYAPLDALFEVVSATGTVGLSSGITHTELPAPLKAVLCADMVLGRVEIVALLIVLYPRTWLGKRTQLT